MSKTAMEERYGKLGPKLVKSLLARSFEAWYVETPEEAAEKALSLIPREDTVSWGGSVTVEDAGLLRALRAGGYKVIDRDAAQGREERLALMREALLCGTFLSGTNAISEDGELVNVDSNGNRVAAMTFGPRQVIVLAGMNKVVKSLEDAYRRARHIAAPANMQRLPGRQTPCAESGTCGDCRSPDCICAYIVTTRRSNPPGRIKVILIGKDMGL